MRVVVDQHIGDQQGRIGLRRVGSGKNRRQVRVDRVPIEDPVPHEVRQAEQHCHDRDGHRSLPQPRTRSRARSRRAGAVRPRPDILGDPAQADEKRAQRAQQVDALVLRQHRGGDEDAEQGAPAGRQSLARAHGGQEQGHREEAQEMIGAAADVAVVDKDAGKKKKHRPCARHTRTRREPRDASRHRRQRPQHHRQFLVEGQHPPQRLAEPGHHPAPRVHQARKLWHVLVVVARERNDAPLARIVLRDGQVVPLRIVVQRLRRHALKVEQATAEHAAHDRRRDQRMQRRAPVGGAYGPPVLDEADKLGRPREEHQRR